jgi:hypothetical protein
MPGFFSLSSVCKINLWLILPKGSPRLPHSPLSAPSRGHLLPRARGQRRPALGDSKTFCSRTACVQPQAGGPQAPPAQCQQPKGCGSAWSSAFALVAATLPAPNAGHSPPTCCPPRGRSAWGPSPPAALPLSDLMSHQWYVKGHEARTRASLRLGSCPAPLAFRKAVLCLTL